MSALRYEIYEDTSGEWRFRLKAGNGETVAIGESYTRKADAVRAVHLLDPDADYTIID